LPTELNARGKARLKRLKEALEEADKYLSQIRPEDLEELCRRDQVTVDQGNPGSTSPGFAVARSGSASTASPVERAVISRTMGKKVRDPLRQDFKKIERNIYLVADTARHTVESLTYLKEGEQKVKGRKVSAPCEDCGILPAVRSGLCEKDFLEWLENGSPDRQRWLRYRHETLHVAPAPRHPSRGGSNEG
jgi:hypothetical protein